MGAGRIIQTVDEAHDWDRNKRRDFQNDALIALTARGHGATVVTANRVDFEILGRRLGVTVLIVRLRSRRPTADGCRPSALCLARISPHHPWDGPPWILADDSGLRTFSARKGESFCDASGPRIGTDDDENVGPACAYV